MIVLAPAAQAQDDDWPELRQFLEKFSQESQDLLEGWADDIAPLLEQLRGKVDDLSLYEPPEVLPNGDIIIRRKPPKPDNEPEMTPEGTVDL
jgi:hypothetical protein